MTETAPEPAPDSTGDAASASAASVTAKLDKKKSIILIAVVAIVQRAATDDGRLPSEDVSLEQLSILGVVPLRQVDVELRAGGTDLEFVVAGAFDRAADANEARAGRAGDAHRFEPRRAVLDDVRHAAERRSPCRRLLRADGGVPESQRFGARFPSG